MIPSESTVDNEDTNDNNSSIHLMHMKRVEQMSHDEVKKQWYNDIETIMSKNCEVEEVHFLTLNNYKEIASWKVIHVCENQRWSKDLHLTILYPDSV